MATPVSRKVDGRRRRRRIVASAAALAISVFGLNATSTPTQAAVQTAPTEAVTNATFTWGVSGYAQKGIFGPWTFKDLTGNVTKLTGSVSGGDQSEYVLAPVPATSMPAATTPAGTQKTPNAVKFTAGTGTVDRDTGEATLTWDGSYTVNAYPAQYNAPNEIYNDPRLQVEADGSGELSMEFTIGAGQDMDGNPTDPVDLGRKTVATFDAGSLSAKTANSYRVTPDYQGVELPAEVATQERSCTTSGGATGWWGSWPVDFVKDIPDFVRPHFYSTGCGGMQDNKPALPFDVSFSATPTVTASKTTLLPTGGHVITINGKGFDPAASTSTRPPLQGRPGGVYVAFGKFAATWKPSAGAPRDARPTSDVKWAVLAADMATIGGPEAGAVELKADGTFTTSLKIDKAAVDTAAGSSAGTYGVYTYPGGGATTPTFETYTPISFAKAASRAATAVTRTSRYGSAKTASVKVAGSAGAPVSGTVTLLDGKRSLGTKTLVGGAAKFALSAKSGVGTHRLSARYSGNANLLPAVSASVSHTVSKTSATVTKKVTRTPTSKRKGKLAVSVRSKARGVTPTGKVKITVYRGKVKKTAIRTISRGKVTVTLARLKKGTWKYKVKYLGNGTHLPKTSSTSKLRIKK